MAGTLKFNIQGYNDGRDATDPHGATPDLYTLLQYSLYDLETGQTTSEVLHILGHDVAKVIPEDPLNADFARDTLGFTNPNLHRRYYPNPMPETVNGYAISEVDKELLPRTYELQISGTDSYRTTHRNTHNEESVYDEIP